MLSGGQSDSQAAFLVQRIDRVLGSLIDREASASKTVPERCPRHRTPPPAPFVGLFGQVWGIMHAFQAIAIGRFVNLSVGSACIIAEALFATAIECLAAADPGLHRHQPVSPARRSQVLQPAGEISHDDLVTAIQRRLMSKGGVELGGCRHPPRSAIRSRRDGGAGERRAALSEINVPPPGGCDAGAADHLHDLGPAADEWRVPLPLAEAQTAPPCRISTRPSPVSIRADGSIFLNTDQVPFAQLSPALQTMAGAGLKRPIYVRADGHAQYAVVAQVMAALSASGFAQINLITDTGGPSSGPHEPPPQTSDTSQPDLSPESVAQAARRRRWGSRATTASWR